MKVIYMTGVPATGKSTIAAKIEESESTVKVISYSDLLKCYLQEKKNRIYTKTEMRTKSSLIITPDDINAVDKKLVDIVIKIREKNHIIIDSHAVTNETYGFRATPFNLSVLKAINFDILVSLYSSVDSIICRIKHNPDGRRILENEELENSLNIQNSLVMTYGIILDKPVYFINTDNEIDYLVNWFIQKLKS